MLKLDEKKIRKGKPIGLPYIGSKKKISKKIVEIIKQNFGTDKTIYDIFGGGGAITAECIVNDLDVHYNDKNTMIGKCLKAITTSDINYINGLLVDRSNFQAIVNKDNKTTTDYLKLLVNSFGNNCKDYLYSEPVSDIKFSLCKEIIDNHNTFDSYRKSPTYIKRLEKYSQEYDDKVLKSLYRLQQLERLNQLLLLRKVQIDSITDYDYSDFSHIQNAILYLDPPYKSIKEYYELTNFEHEEFYNWAYEMSKDNIVLISSYNIEDDRFTTVFEFPNVRSTMSGGFHGECEKLFMVKEQYLKSTVDKN